MNLKINSYITFGLDPPDFFWAGIALAVQSGKE
jgi:hypothetical protein